MWFVFFFFFFKQKTAYEMRISDWSSDVCSSDLHRIVLTGASGWLGRATSDLLQNALGDAFAERVFCFGSRQAELRLSETQLIMQRPLADLIKLPYQPTYLLHFAFLTKDRDRKSTRLTPVTNAHLVCRLLLEKKNKITHINI